MTFRRCCKRPRCQQLTKQPSSLIPLLLNYTLMGTVQNYCAFMYPVRSRDYQVDGPAKVFRCSRLVSFQMQLRSHIKKQQKEAAKSNSHMHKPTISYMQVLIPKKQMAFKLRSERFIHAIPHSFNRSSCCDLVFNTLMQMICRLYESYKKKITGSQYTSSDGLAIEHIYYACSEQSFNYCKKQSIPVRFDLCLFPILQGSSR